MTRLILTIAVAAVVGLAAFVWQRLQKPAAPTDLGGELPTVLDRDDFTGADVPWLIAVFSSATCMACADVLAHVRSIESSTVAVQDVEVALDPELHRRYRIDSVPATLAVDRDGVVRGSWLGPLAPADQAELDDLILTR